MSQTNPEVIPLQKQLAFMDPSEITLDAVLAEMDREFWSDEAFTTPEEALTTTLFSVSDAQYRRIASCLYTAIFSLPEVHSTTGKLMSFDSAAGLSGAEPTVDGEADREAFLRWLENNFKDRSEIYHADEMTRFPAVMHLYRKYIFGRNATQHGSNYTAARALDVLETEMTARTTDIASRELYIDQRESGEPWHKAALETWPWILDDMRLHDEPSGVYEEFEGLNPDELEQKAKEYMQLEVPVSTRAIEVLYQRSLGRIPTYYQCCQTPVSD